MIHYDMDLFYDNNLDLFYEIDNTINENNQRQTHYLLLIQNNSDIYFLNESKSSFITSKLVIISMLSLFECITRSSSLFMEKVKLFATVNLIFYVADFFRLFMMSFKYGLILLRYS